MQPYNQFICGHDGDALEIRNEATSGTYQPAQWFSDWATGGKSDAGVAVNAYTALTHPAIWQAVNIIAGDFGQTPVRLMRDEFDEQENHPAAKLLTVKPNELQTPAIWKETMMAWKLIHGNAVSWIIRQGSRPAELIPLRPDCVWSELVSYEGRAVQIYHYQSPYEATLSLKLLPWEVVHFKGLTHDGVWGYPLWQIARNTIGHGLALQRHSNTNLANGARPSGLLKHPGKLQPEARKNLRDEWNSVHAGPGNVGKVAILMEGMEYDVISSTNAETQLLEEMQFDVYQASRLFNLPPHRLGAMGATTFNNIEEQNAEYKSSVFSRHCNAADEEYRWKLLTTVEWLSGKFWFKHDTDNFLKADLDTSTQIADRMVKATVWNPNEARRTLGYPPREGGEVYGSPAINPNSNNENSPSSAGKTPKTATKSPNPAEVKSKLANAIDNEVTMLRAAASSKKNFVGWLDAFYGRAGHKGTIADILEHWLPENTLPKPKMRRVVGRFNSWAYSRRESLLDLSSVTKSDGLAAAVEIFTLDSAAEIADELLDGIFEE